MKRIPIQASDFPQIHPQIFDIITQRGIATFYPPQIEALQKGSGGKNLLVSIPTASGKTLIAEILALNSFFHDSTLNLQNTKNKHKKILYLCPLRALAQEKYQEFKESWGKIGLRVGLASGDLDDQDFRVFGNDMIILTNEKADALLRMNPGLSSQIGTIISDEIHLLGDESRGITLEILLTRFRNLDSNIQIIGLSATVQNAREIADWLDAELVLSDWRPVELKEGIFLDGEIHFLSDDEEVRQVKCQEKDEVACLVKDMLAEQGQVLIFNNSRRSSVSVAKNLYKGIRKFVSEETRQIFSEVQQEFKKIMSDLEISALEMECLGGGIAFHHAGMDSKELTFIVENFNHRRIKVITCTPTLAAGVNTPARRVIIRSLYRYEGDKGMTKIPVMEYKQMAGRAGRPRYDPYGEVIILGTNKERLKLEALEFIAGDTEIIKSQLSQQYHLESHILGLIAAKIAQTKEALMEFLQRSLYFHQMIQFQIKQQSSSSREFQHANRLPLDQRRKIGRGNDPLNQFTEIPNQFMSADKLVEANKKKKQIEISNSSKNQKGGNKNVPDLIDVKKMKTDLNETKTKRAQENATNTLLTQLDLILTFFLKKKFISQIEEAGKSVYEATKFGKITTQMYLPPRDAVIIHEDLHYAMELHNNNEIQLQPISWLHMISKLESFMKFYLRKEDYPKAIEFIDKHWESFILEEVLEPLDPDFEDFAKEIKTTMILRDWINEIHQKNIAENFNIGVGDIHRAVEMAQWLARATTQISAIDHSEWKEQFKDLELRLIHGIKEQLIPLVKLKGIGRVRARKLYNAGFKTLNAIKKADLPTLAIVPDIGENLARKIQEQLLNPETPMKRKKRSTKRTKKTARKTLQETMKNLSDPDMDTLDEEKEEYTKTTKVSESQTSNPQKLEKKKPKSNLDKFF